MSPSLDSANPQPEGHPPEDPSAGRFSSAVDEDEREYRLAALLSSLADQVAQGKWADLEEQCRVHPDLATDLRELWGTVLMTDAAGLARHSSPAEIQKSTWYAPPLPTKFGDYELLEELGRGGMGIVFRATQISLGREVAIKMILRGGLASEMELRRFLIEASATARLQHPHIVPVYEVGDFEGRPYFSMQLIQGRTLADLLLDGPLPDRTAALLVMRAAEAIDHAHRQGILHRDLKPSNILLDEQGQPHVTDFGLAKKISDETKVTRSGMVVGTPAYMSPEQASPSRMAVGPASDVYSLGCVLYHALTGQPPLFADSPVEMMMMILEQEPVPPRLIRPSIDRDLEMIVIRCLQKPIDLRYESAAELAADLRAFLNDEQVAARSGRFAQVVARLFRETHHASVLENWGLLWMWHSLVLLVVCGATWILEYQLISRRLAYASLWTVGLGAWAVVFWFLRRRLGPVTFVERQVAHLWAASMLGIGLLFPLEWWLGLQPLTLSPLLGVFAAMVFLVKAGMFSGAFYVQAGALILTSVAMALWPRHAHLFFGIVSAGCFFFPGLKYYRRRLDRPDRDDENNDIHFRHDQ